MHGSVECFLCLVINLASCISEDVKNVYSAKFGDLRSSNLSGYQSSRNEIAKFVSPGYKLVLYWRTRVGRMALYHPLSDVTRPTPVTLAVT
eukprot:5885156-Pleurochrysis_carterae.AAC.1